MTLVSDAPTEQLSPVTGSRPPDEAEAGQPRRGAQLEAVDVSAWFGSNKVLDRVSLSMRRRR